MCIVPAIAGFSCSRVCQMQYNQTNLDYLSRSFYKITETSFPLENLTSLNFHVPIKFEIFTEAIALIFTVTNYCIWQTRKKQLTSDSSQLETIKLSNVLAIIFNHIKTQEKEESLKTDKTNYEIIKNIKIEIGRKLHNLFKSNCVC